VRSLYTKAVPFRTWGCDRGTQAVRGDNCRRILEMATQLFALGTAARAKRILNGDCG
jgi:hypothetical protein